MSNLRIIKRIAASIVFLLCGVVGTINAQKYQYPFQNPNLSEEKRIDNLISLMTIDEKIDVIQGRGVERLGIPSPGSTEAIHGIVRGGSSNIQQRQNNNRAAMQTAAHGAAPQGVQGQPAQTPQRFPGFGGVRLIHSTAFPQGYGMGETWDRDILKMMGEVMSYEARYHSNKTGRNCLVLWSPNADLGRDPRWGRTEECFGEDPYLVGELVVAESKGIQGDDPKHWRGAVLMKHFLANSHEDGRCYTSSDFGEDLFHDYYAYGFWKGVVKGGARSLMAAYNQYLGVPASANKFIREVLIDRWGMDGMIVNDGGALAQLMTHHKYVDTMEDAVRVSLEAGISRFLNNYTKETKSAFEKGMISEELIDANLRFNFRTFIRLGMLDDTNPYKNLGANDEVAPWETKEFKDKALLATQKSVVLLKNEGNLLPLDTKKVKKIAVFGNRAEEVLKDWYGALPAYTVSPLEGIQTAVKNDNVEVKFLRWDSDGQAQKLAEWADVAIVCVGNHPLTSPDWDGNTIQAPWGYGTSPSDGREAVDRRSLQLDTEDLIKVVWQANKNTVVALISSFPYTINWTQENVPAIVHMTQCSQELGTALADVLFGKYNPAGRLTQTWVKDILDLPNMLDYDITKGRTYMYFKGEPLYPFGFGLSYTTFQYSNMKAKQKGGNLVVSFDITNTGSRDGEEVAQVYLKFPGDSAAKRLRGFDRVAIAQGATKNVTIIIPEEDLKLWSLEKHDFAKPKGQLEVMVGASSADIRLNQTVKL